jgi:hypothetical protein
MQLLHIYLSQMLTFPEHRDSRPRLAATRKISIVEQLIEGIANISAFLGVARARAFTARKDV